MGLLFKPQNTLLLVFVSVLIFSKSSVCSENGENEATALLEKADGLVRELTQTIEKLQATQNADVFHLIRKRSASERKMDDILKRFQNICALLDWTPPKKSTTPVTNSDTVTATTVVPKHTSASDLNSGWTPENGKWSKPDVYITKTETERKGSDFIITLSVSHTSQAYITTSPMSETASSFRVTIGPEGSYLKRTDSSVTVTIDASHCNASVRSIFSLRSGLKLGLVDSSYYLMSVDLNLCEFDLVYNKTTKKLEKTEGVLVEKYRPPEFQIMNDPGDVILLNPNKNLTFVLAVKKNPGVIFEIKTNLWDWDEDRLYNETHEYYARLNEDANLFSPAIRVKELTEIPLNAGSNVQKDDCNGNGDEDYSKISIFEIEIDTTSESFSGQLYINSRREIYEGSEHIFSDIDIKRMIWLRLPYRLSALPRSHVEIYAYDVKCNPAKTSICRVECSASGMNIHSIQVIKADPFVPPVTSTSTIFPDMVSSSYAENDMGPPSADIEGRYRCVVITDDGDFFSKDFNVNTTDFTEITSAFVEDNGNETVTMVCKAKGRQPLTMSFEGTLQSGTFYDDITKVVDGEAKREITNGTTTLTLTTPVIQLRGGYLGCHVEGPRGRESQNIDIENMQ